jgi:multidrug transporter EmrE-like cation transporter
MQILESLFLVIIGAGLTLLGDVFLKKSQLQNYQFLGLGLLFYACGVIPVAIIFKKMEFSTVFLVWEAVTIIVAMVVASWYFKETFTVSKALAMVFALVALYFSYK